MDNEPSFQELLDSFDFTAAREQAASALAGEQSSYEAQIIRAETQAANQAEQLAGRIQALARADHYEGLLALADDPTTAQLLNLLSVEILRGAELHLDGAKRRQLRFQTSAVKHMSAAADALVLLDTATARSELDRIDERWLDDTQRSELATLNVQVTDAAAERRELDERTAEVLRDHHPSQGGKAKRKAASSPSAGSGPGCGTNALALMGLILLVVAL